MVHHVVAASIAMTIVAVEVEVGTVVMVAATTTAIAAPLATKIVSVAPTADVAMTTVLAELTVTPLVVAMIATAAVATTIVVVLSLTAEMVAEMVGALQVMWMPLQGRPEIPTEVETKISVLTIGTLVDRLRSANLLRCGAFCQIAHPNLPTILACLRCMWLQHMATEGSSILLRCSRVTTDHVMSVLASVLSTLLQRWYHRKQLHV